MELRRGWVGRRVDSRSTASSGAGGCASGSGRRASDGARSCDDCSAASAASTDVSIGEWGAGVGAGVVEVNEGATSRPSGLRGCAIRNDSFQLKGR